ncbi:MAG TPA: MFS transporter [Steroidobacteraceae bacterium]|nr:MFS transporter [Steroidobacteraceae bacterium]
MRVRSRIFWLLFGFGLMAYVQQRSLGVAAVPMMAQLGLSQMQIGWLETAFISGYAALQFPGGILGQRLGARLAFTLVMSISLCAGLLTPLAPLVLHAQALFIALLGLQLLLGLAQAPLFPLYGGVFETWFPPSLWPLVQGGASAGLGLGAALTPPLVAWLMTAFGWQKALIYSALPLLALIVVWAWYGRDTPRTHPGVTRVELDELGAHAGAQVDSHISWRRIAALIGNREILLLTLSYLCMNYTFYLISNWTFLYLIQERHLPIIESGWLTAAPALGSAVGAGGGGVVASALVRRYGARWGLRIVPLAGLPASAVLLLLAVHTPSAYVAVGALTACFAAVELTEGPYWAAIMNVARADSMAACGILNTGANCGGLVATPIVAYLSGHHAWSATFVLGVAFAAVSAALWLVADPAREIAAD